MFSFSNKYWLNYSLNKITCDFAHLLQIPSRKFVGVLLVKQTKNNKTLIFHFKIWPILLSLSRLVASFSNFDLKCAQLNIDTLCIRTSRVLLEKKIIKQYILNVRQSFTMLNFHIYISSPMQLRNIVYHKYRFRGS